MSPEGRAFVLCVFSSELPDERRAEEVIARAARIIFHDHAARR